MTLGDTTTFMSCLYIGYGQFTAATNVGGVPAIAASGVTGTNAGGMALQIFGGAATGNGKGGSITFGTALPGTSGTTPHGQTASALGQLELKSASESRFTVGLSASSIAGTVVLTPGSVAAANAGITIPLASVVQITAGTATSAFAITMPTGTEGLHLTIFNNTAFATTTGAAIPAGVTWAFIYLGGAWQHKV
jgi:hypothetical protein